MKRDALVDVFQGGSHGMTSKMVISAARYMPLIAASTFAGIEVSSLAIGLRYIDGEFSFSEIGSIVHDVEVIQIWCTIQSYII